LVYLEQKMHLLAIQRIRLGAMVTFLLSIVVNGLSAMPDISQYARKITALGSAPAHQQA
jgi:hypothetical protein